MTVGAVPPDAPARGPTGRGSADNAPKRAAPQLRQYPAAIRLLCRFAVALALLWITKQAT